MIRRYSFICLFVLTIVALVQAGNAIPPDSIVQEGNAAPPDSIVQRDAKRIAHAALSNPLATSAISSGDVTTTFLASKEKDRAIATIAVSRYFNVKLSGPISTNDERTRLVTLDGLENSAVLDVGLRYNPWSPKFDKAKLPEIRNRFVKTDYYKRKQTEIRNGLRMFSLDGDDLKALREEAKFDEHVISRLQPFKQLLASRVLFEKQLRDSLGDSVTDEQIRLIVIAADDTYGSMEGPAFTYLNVKDANDDALIEMYEDAVDMGTPLLLEMRFKVGRETYAYADTAGASVQEMETSENNFGFEASTGFVGRHNYIGFSYKIDRAYRPAGGPTDLIVPLSNGIESIKKVTIGAPKLKTHSRFQFEYRRLVNRHLACKPTFTLFIGGDDVDDIYSFDLPVYFFQGTDGGLTGGIVWSYRSDSKEIATGLFVGNVFSIVSL